MSNQRIGRIGFRKWETITEWNKLVRLDRINLFHGTCTKPKHVRLAANVSYDRAPGGRLLSDLMVRCRKCPECLRAFVSHWSYRTEQEIAAADRARLLTLTFARQRTTHQIKELWRAYLRKIRDKEARKAKRESKCRCGTVTPIKRGRCTNCDAPVNPEGRTPTLLRVIPVIERGEQNTKRLHVHAIVVEHGPPIPRRFYKDRSRENPAGCWLDGFVNTKLIRETPENAARYVLKYVLKDSHERWPSGRRVQASPFWGRGKPQVLAALAEHKRRTREALRRSLALLDRTRDNARCSSDTLPRCALLTKPPPSANVHTEANASTGPPQTWSDALLTGDWTRGATLRLLQPSEIPPEIAKLWFAKEDA